MTLPKMWRHYCTVEDTPMMIGQGEECSWCGAEENPEPYRNEMAEAVEILARIDKKIDLLFKKAGVEDNEI